MTTAPGAPGAGGAQTPTTAGVVNSYIAALNRHDADAIARLVSDDFHNEHTSLGATGLRGRAAYRERLGSFLATYADLHYDVEDLVVEDERAALAYRMTFRWLGNGEPGVPVTVRGVFRFRVLSGKIVHRVDYWDSGQVQRQIEQIEQIDPQ